MWMKVMMTDMQLPVSHIASIFPKTMLHHRRHERRPATAVIGSSNNKIDTRSLSLSTDKPYTGTE